MQKNQYRDDARYVAKEAGWTFRRFLPLFLGVVAVLFIVGFGLNSLGIFGRTVVERKVFEQSFQRSESLKARIATDEATLAEIERKLRNTGLDANTRTNLEAQAAAARIRISTARAQQ